MIRGSGFVSFLMVATLVLALFPSMVLGKEIQVCSIKGDTQSAKSAIGNVMESYSILKRIFGNERANIYISNEKPYHVITEGGRVVELDEGELDDPSIKVYSDCDTLVKMKNRELSPVDALEQKKVRYEGVGFLKKIKLGFLSLISRLGLKLLG